MKPGACLLTLKKDLGPTERRTRDRKVAGSITGTANWSASQLVSCFDFDAGDPEERQDLSKSQPDLMKLMMNRLQRWMASGVPPQNAPIDPKGDPKNWGGVWSPGWC